VILLLLVLAASSVHAQTTSGILRGRVLDAVDERAPQSRVLITCRDNPGVVNVSTIADSQGNYSFPLLPPGEYQLTVTAASYQRAEVHRVIVPVAGIVEQSFFLRPETDLFDQRFTGQLTVPGTKHMVRFYGPDLDFSRTAFVKVWESGIRIFEPSISNVIDPVPIRHLPFAGRDLYTMLLTQPAVTSDSGTARSLGLSANGQRPASSNFLLDGIELNNSLTAGPLIAPPPEAIQEYRISLSSYSAEYGGTSGFLANAVSHSGTPQWHGIVYGNAKNEALHANDFQNNLMGTARPREREVQFGYRIGGPLSRRAKIYFSSSLEHLRSSGRQPEQSYVVPGDGFLRFLQTLSTGNRARQLFSTYLPPPSEPIRGEAFAAVSKLRAPVTLRRAPGIQRLDLPQLGSHRFLLRWMTNHLDRPDFIWSPYPEFTSGLSQTTMGVSSGLVSTFSPRLTHEFRFGWNKHRMGWERAHADFPTLTVSSGNPAAPRPLMPGSPAAYSYTNATEGSQLLSNVLLTLGRHVFKTGGSFHTRGIVDDLPYAVAGRYNFPSLADVAFGTGVSFFAPYNRTALLEGRTALPDLDRHYRQNHAAAFLQDSVRLSSRATLNAGVRFEHSGSPVHRSAGSALLLPMPYGNDTASALENSRPTAVSVRDARVYDGSQRTMGVRLGFAYNLAGNTVRIARPVLRGGYGMFHDQTFDNVWLNIRNNFFVFPSAGIGIPNGSDYLQPASQAISRYAVNRSSFDFPTLTAFESPLNGGVVHHYFAGVQVQLVRNVHVEVNGLGASARRLLTTDTINRQFSVPFNDRELSGCDTTRYQPCLPDVAYRSATGSSDYRALSASATVRRTFALLSVNYTFGHVMDVQSDPLKGDFFDLTFQRARQPAGFARQFDSRADRGSADFDQRQNLVVYSIWPVRSSRKLRWLTRGWRVSQIAAFRSGFPFTVTDAIRAPSAGGTLLVRRADLLHPNPSRSSDADGGRKLLNIGAFCAPAACDVDRSKQGNTGRNAFRGPGLYNVDASLARTLSLRRLGEGRQVTIRADALNVLNHANLGPPEADLSLPSSFGIARYGRQLRDIGIPTLLPLRETARQIQLLIRLEF